MAPPQPPGQSNEEGGSAIAVISLSFFFSPSVFNESQFSCHSLKAFYLYDN